MKLPISTMMLIMVAGLCFVMYVSFNYAFHSDDGIRNKLWESANKTLTGDQATKFNDLMPQLTQGFGIAGVLCMLLAIVIFVLDAFSHPPREM